MVDYENKLKSIIENDIYMMSVLKAVEKLNLEDAWVCAGFIRNKVWDISHNITTPLNDIDVIYFDATDTSLEKEKQLETKLEFLLPDQPWSVKSLARMYLRSGFISFTSSYYVDDHFPENSTGSAVIIYNRYIEIMAPYVLQDLFEMRVTPIPFF